MAIAAELPEQAVESVMRQEVAQRLIRYIPDQEAFQRVGQRTVIAQGDQHP